MEDFCQHPKYSDFIVHTTTYKQVQNHHIAVDVFVPKSLIATLPRERMGQITTRPIILRFHGGGLFTGMSLYPDWFPPYLLKYASRHEIPIISPDYRLMPECTGLDILDDLNSFWNWVHRGLQCFVSSIYPSLELDANNILAEGESAGGYLVVQAALSRLPGLHAVIAAFPMLDLRAPHYTKRHENVTDALQNSPQEIIQDHLKSVRKGDVVSSILPPARLDLGAAVILEGRYVEFLGDDEVLFPIERLKRSNEWVGMLPRLWIYHGKQDTGIPAAGSIEFAKQAKTIWTDAEIRLDLPDGEHGFHKDAQLDTTEWLKDGLAWATEPWLYRSNV